MEKGNIEEEYWDLKAGGIDIDGLCDKVQALINKEKQKMMSTKIKDDVACDHKGTIVFIETSLMADMTMETLAECSKCKKQLIIKGGEFTPINNQDDRE